MSTHEYGISQFSNEDTTYVYYYGVIRDTPEAFLFNTDFGNMWIPKSQIQKKDAKMFAIPTWLAKSKKIPVDKLRVHL